MCSGELPGSISLVVQHSRDLQGVARFFSKLLRNFSHCCIEEKNAFIYFLLKFIEYTLHKVVNKSSFQIFSRFKKSRDNQATQFSGDEGGAGGCIVDKVKGYRGAVFHKKWRDISWRYHSADNLFSISSFKQLLSHFLVSFS